MYLRQRLRDRLTTLLNSLRSDETGRRYDQVSKAHKLTFDWVFKRRGVGLIEWLENDRELFWINGKPGSGKSTVLKHICNNLYQNNGRSIGLQDKAAISRDCNNNEVWVDEEDVVGNIPQRGPDAMREFNGDDSAEADCSDTSSTETSESMGNWSGIEGGVHSEPPGETNAYFFFSHRGS